MYTLKIGPRYKKIIEDFEKHTNTKFTKSQKYIDNDFRGLLIDPAHITEDAHEIDMQKYWMRIDLISKELWRISLQN